VLPVVVPWLLLDPPSPPLSLGPLEQPASPAIPAAPRPLRARRLVVWRILP